MISEGEIATESQILKTNAEKRGKERSQEARW